MRPDTRVMRAPEVIRETGLSRTTLWRKARDGSFPRPIQLSVNAIGWRARDVFEWLAERPDTETRPQA